MLSMVAPIRRDYCRQCLTDHIFFFIAMHSQSRMGGVSYSVDAAAAPPTLVSATPTSWLATPIFDSFWSFFGF